MRRVWLVAAAALLLCSGCRNTQLDAVRQRAGAFETAVDQTDWARACRHLAPSTQDELTQSGDGSCAHGLAAEELAVPGHARDVKVFGTTALVLYAHDTLFLSRFADGWRVVAAGCTPAPNRPYDCTVQGG